MKFKLTKALEDHLEGLPHSSTIRQRQWVSMNDLLYLHKKHLSHLPLKQLCHGLEVYHMPKPVKTYSVEFQRQLDLLRVKQEESEYQEMVNRGLVKKDDDYVSPSQMHKELKEQMTTICNILISVLSVVYAIWYWTSNELVFKLHTRVLLCLFFGILILVAEVVVYNSFLRKMDDAKVKEKNKKEIKKIVDTVIIKSI